MAAKGELVTVECFRCGKRMDRWPSAVAKSRTGRFFCSRACSSAPGSMPRRVPPRVCQRCGGEFYPATPSNPNLFCSKACYDEHQRRNRVEKTCPVCGVRFGLAVSEARRRNGDSRGKGVRYCSRKCMAAGQTVNGLGRVHNGREAILNRQGYVLIYEPDHPKAALGRVLEHRWVVEQKIGRPLRSDEQVHHVNGDRLDNRPENLAVLDPKAHTLVTLSESGLRRAAQQRRIRELEAEVTAYRERFGPLV